MRQTKESNKHAPGRVVIYILVHLASIYTLTFSNVLLVLALNLIVHKSSYCKYSLAWCQVRTFLLFTIWTHPLQMREYPLQYASTDKNKKSHYNNFTQWKNGSVDVMFTRAITHHKHLAPIREQEIWLECMKTSHSACCLSIHDWWPGHICVNYFRDPFIRRDLFWICILNVEQQWMDA